MSASPMLIAVGVVGYATIGAGAAAVMFYIVPSDDDTEVLGWVLSCLCFWPVVAPVMLAYSLACEASRRGRRRIERQAIELERREKEDKEIDRIIAEQRL